MEAKSKLDEIIKTNSWRKENIERGWVIATYNELTKQLTNNVDKVWLYNYACSCLGAGEVNIHTNSHVKELAIFSDVIKELNDDNFVKCYNDIIKFLNANSNSDMDFTCVNFIENYLNSNPTLSSFNKLKLTTTKKQLIIRIKIDQEIKFKTLFHEGIEDNCEDSFEDTPIEETNENETNLPIKSKESNVINRQIVSKTFHKNQIVDKTFTCYNETLKKNVEIKITGFMKDSNQSEHCVYYANMILDNKPKPYRVVVKVAYCGPRKKKYKYKFMSDEKINKLNENYCLLKSYLEQLNEKFENKFGSITVCKRMILRVVENNYFPNDVGFNNYLWIEQIIMPFKHFWSDGYPNDKLKTIVSVRDSLLLELQKAIYEISLYKHTLIDIQGRYKENSYILSDIEFTDTLLFFENTLTTWCTINDVVPQPFVIDDNVPAEYWEE